jgi:hypothetical protein
VVHSRQARAPRAGRSEGDAEQVHGDKAEDRAPQHAAEDQQKAVGQAHQPPVKPTSDLRGRAGTARTTWPRWGPAPTGAGTARRTCWLQVAQPPCTGAGTLRRTSARQFPHGAGTARATVGCPGTAAPAAVTETPSESATDASAAPTNFAALREGLGETHQLRQHLVRRTRPRLRPGDPTPETKVWAAPSRFRHRTRQLHIDRAAHPRTRSPCRRAGGMCAPSGPRTRAPRGWRSR